MADLRQHVLFAHSVTLLVQAAARVRLANDEGDPILSAWLKDAEALIEKTNKRDGILQHNFPVCVVCEFDPQTFIRGDRGCASHGCPIRQLATGEES